MLTCDLLVIIISKLGEKKSMEGHSLLLYPQKIKCLQVKLCCSLAPKCQDVNRKGITNNSISNNEAAIRQPIAAWCFKFAVKLVLSKSLSLSVFSDQLLLIEYSYPSMIQSEGLYLADCHWSATGNCAIDLCQMVTLCQWCSNGDWTFAG